MISLCLILQIWKDSISKILHMQLTEALVLQKKIAFFSICAPYLLNGILHIHQAQFQSPTESCLLHIFQHKGIRKSLYQKCCHAVFLSIWIMNFQGYGSTEAGGISLMIGREECSRIGSAGRVSENVEVKIVDHVTGKPLSVAQKGELLVRGPAVMIGNRSRYLSYSSY